MNGTEHRLRGDLDEILARAGDDLRTLRNSTLFLSGGTGFVGSWLLESLVWANERDALNVKTIVLTRNPERFQRIAPHLANGRGVAVVRGDVCQMPRGLARVDGVIHAATPASADINRDRPLEMLDTIFDGGRNVLNFAAGSGKIPVLFTSSGAVYGKQPTDISHVDEDYVGAPDCLNPINAYHEGKRAAELQCSLFAKQLGIVPKIARLFAFVGPYLPLDRHFAIGNFINDALAQRTIEVGGDGTTVRSYLYAAEMTIWLWAIYARGDTLRAYNVGSENAVTISELANAVAGQTSPQGDVRIHGTPVPGRAVDQYVPSTARIRSELAVEELVGLGDAIAKTMRFHTTC